MAGTTGPTPYSLIEQIKAEPTAWDFCRAMRLLQCHFGSQPRTGYSLSPAQDPVRFAQSPELDFAPSTLEKLETPPAPSPPRLFVRHFGLFGPNGPLPLRLTEYAHERRHNYSDRTFAAFCDVFHHRLLSFFFRAWADNQKTLDLDRPTEQRWIDWLGSLLGIGMASLQERDAVPDWDKLYFSGRLVLQTRNAEGLEAIVQDDFGIKTEVRTFAGRWVDVPPDSVCRLGASPATGALGLNVIVGSQVWDCQLSFRLRLGPMRLADFERLLPTGASFKRLRDWIRNYCGDVFFWDAQFVLLKDEVPSTRLGQYGRLGWTTWLKTRPFAHDADDLILQPPPNQPQTRISRHG